MSRSRRNALNLAIAILLLVVLPLDATSNHGADRSLGSVAGGIDRWRVVNDRLYFPADDGRHGQELWVSDGTRGGTRLLRDVNRGPADGGPWVMGAVAGQVLFAADDREHGREVWRTDGTREGTRLVSDIREGLRSSTSWGTAATLGEWVIFPANDGEHGLELWRSDGTRQGTTLLLDVDPDGSSRPAVLGTWDGLAYFVARDGAHRWGLWRTDGTPEGTWSLLDVRNGVEVLGMADDRLVFVTDHGNEGRFLWSTDGTSDGTHVLAIDAFDTRDSGPGVVACAVETEDGQRLLFNGATGENYGYGIWKTDGTSEGSTLVVDTGAIFGSADCVVAGEVDDPVGEPISTTYWTWDDDSRIEPPDEHLLWRMAGADPTSEVLGTFRRITLRSECSGQPDRSRHRASPDGAELVFFASEPEHGNEPWVTDGTPGGTHLLRDIRPGKKWGVRDCSDLTDANGLTFFWANDGRHGHELWVTDGTSEGTRLVKDVRRGAPASSWSTDVIPLGDVVVFAANDGLHGFEPWRSDGTKDGTRMLRDIDRRH